MNKYLHLGTLVAALSMGCAANSAVVKPAESVKPAEPVKEAEPLQSKEEFKWPYFCDKVDLKDGAYNAGTPAMPATYYVLENPTECGLLLEGRLNVLYIDLGCDNTMDSGYTDGITFSRKQAAKEGGDLNIVDTALRLGQSFVCKENRIDKE